MVTSRLQPYSTYMSNAGKDKELIEYEKGKSSDDERHPSVRPLVRQLRGAQRCVAAEMNDLTHLRVSIKAGGSLMIGRHPITWLAESGVCWAPHHGRGHSGVHSRSEGVRHRLNRSFRDAVDVFPDVDARSTRAIHRPIVDKPRSHLGCHVKRWTINTSCTRARMRVTHRGANTGKRPAKCGPASRTNE